MLVSIPRNVYFRTYGKYGYLFNQRNWTSALIEDIENFRRLFARHPVDLDVATRQIAHASSVDECIVRRDIEDLVTSLATNGYLILGSTVIFEQKDMALRGRSEEHTHSGRAKEVESGGDGREKATRLLNEYFLEHPTPFELCIDLTRACTERCVHCYVPRFQNVTLPYATIEKVMGEFAAMGGLKVKLTGGECMLHPDFERILELVRAHDMVISVLSNLTRCDEDKANAIRNADVAVVQVSLYGMTPETHEAVTQVKGSLAQTLCGIDLLQAHGVPLQIHCPVLKQNAAAIESVGRFGRLRGMKTTFDAVMMAHADHACGDACGLSDAELQEFMIAHEDLSDALLTCSEIDPNDRVCEIGTAKICLSSEGKYYPCNGCYGLELGDCRRQTLSEVWSAEPMRRLRMLRMADLPRCVSCPNRSLCSPCPARNFNATGDLTKPDPAMCRAVACRRSIVAGRTKKGD